MAGILMRETTTIRLTSPGFFGVTIRPSGPAAQRPSGPAAQRPSGLRFADSRVFRAGPRTEYRAAIRPG